MYNNIMLGLELPFRIVVTVKKMEVMLSMMLRGLRKPMDAVKASMGDLTPFSYLTPNSYLTSVLIGTNGSRVSDSRYSGRKFSVV